MANKNLEAAFHRLVEQHMTVEYRLCRRAEMSDNEARAFAIGGAMEALTVLEGAAPSNKEAVMARLNQVLNDRLNTFTHPELLDMPDFDDGAKA